MLPEIDVVTAAAGAGKTTRIVRDISEEVTKRAPEEIVATTFTIKAAAELLERARGKLFEQGKTNAASRLLGARFGTVNAVCGQLVSEYAIDLGRAPGAEVIDERSEALVFTRAATRAISKHAPILNELAALLGFTDPRPKGIEAPDWRRTVRDILKLARANGISSTGLLGSADRSIATFGALLPSASTEADQLDRQLALALKAALKEAPDSPSATAEKYMALLRSANFRLGRGERIPWSMWASLTKVSCAKKDGTAFKEAIEDVCEAAGQYCHHPTLRADCEKFITHMFECASEALEAYQTYKSERGLMDFIDQEALALDILRNPALAARIKERVGRAYVDEFQDSSPLQLAVFTALAQIVEKSTWVGDPKQAIYGFRGADTNLTQAAFAGAMRTKSGAEVLARSWRSREGIIQFANAAFSPALEKMDLPAKDHAFSGTERTEDGFSQPPIHYWPLNGKVDEQALALAGGIRSMLDEVNEWVVEGHNKIKRPLTCGDIAVLCRTNTEVTRIASAISRAGLQVAVERPSLIRTPHSEFVLAAYRWVADATDTLALAELARFFSDEPKASSWLDAACGEDSRVALRGLVPVDSRLEALRLELTNLTPAELLDAIITLPEMSRRVAQWGDYEMRLNDLEALRGYARRYEAECAASGDPATPSGLILALEAANALRPASTSGDAVKVMTYHGAKGLEWPVVVLAGLSWESKARIFEPVAESDGLLNWQDPLANRWIRYWPWPFGLSGSGCALDDNAEQSEFGKKAWAQAVQEDTRLLYVGVTRARDYLVFAPPGKAGATWLKVLDSDGGTSHIVFPSSDQERIRVGSESVPVGYKPLDPPISDAEYKPRKAYVRPHSTPTPRAPLFIRPSDRSDEAGWRVAERVTLGPRLSLDGISDMRIVGEAVHAALAYDDVTRPAAVRLADANSVLRRWRAKGLAAEDVLRASDRLNNYLAAKWPRATLIREAPVVADLDGQLLNGRIDLLIDTEANYIIVDHKSFPGSFDLWEERAKGYAPQLGLYARGVTSATNKPCEELWIHLPLVGAMLRVTNAQK